LQFKDIFSEEFNSIWLEDELKNANSIDNIELFTETIHFFKHFVYKIINFDYLKNALIHFLETSRMFRTVSVVTVVQRISTGLIELRKKSAGKKVRLLNNSRKPAAISTKNTFVLTFHLLENVL